MTSVLKVDTIQDQSGNNIINESGDTITIGASGDTITIPSGATFNTGSATVTLPSTINVTTVVLAAGAVGTPSLTTSGDTNTGIFFPSADTIAFTEGGSEAMRIDSSGRVGIGTTAPDNRLEVQDVGSGVNKLISIRNGDSTNNHKLTIGYNAGALSGFIPANATFIIGETGGAYGALAALSIGTVSSTPIILATNNTERMRITSDGNVLVAGTSFNANGSVCISAIGTGTNGCTAVSASALATNIWRFYNTNGQVGGIVITGSATAFNTSSDYRLKENVNYNFDATTRFKQLKPARFNFIVEPNKTVDGFLAHEVQDIIPEAITGNKDETETKEKVVVNNIGRVIAENIEQADWEAGKIPNEEGTSQYPIDSTWETSKNVPVYQGIDQSKLTPILTKALQEAIARIEQLEARLTALESN